MRRFPVQTALAVLTFVVVLLVFHGVINPIKGLDNKTGTDFYRSVTQFDLDTTPPLPIMPVREVEDLMQQARSLNSTILEDDSGALDHFYQALWGAERHEPGRKVRLVHYGDSPTTADLITGDARELLQRRFGNAGHGFILVSKPWAWYEHRDVEISSSGWAATTAVETTHEGDFGLGGAVFQGATGTSSHFKLRDHTYSQVEVEYEAEPHGGDLQITASGKPVGIVHTAADAKTSGFETLSLPPQTDALDLKVLSGQVRVFGVSFEKNGPGLTYDSLGLNGASTVVMSRTFSDKMWTEELQHRHPDLIIINYGTNEAGFSTFVEKQYEKELRLAIKKVKAAVPESSILIMSPMDRGKRNGSAIETMNTIPEIIAIQEKVAKETGCGFFNTFAAMGGDSTMARWYQSQPRMVAADLIHPTPKGARLVADAFVKQLVLGFYRYKLRHVDQIQMASASTRRLKRNY